MDNYLINSISEYIEKEAKKSELRFVWLRLIKDEEMPEDTEEIRNILSEDVPYAEEETLKVIYKKIFKSNYDEE